jgi:hypothetical protein
VKSSLVSYANALLVTAELGSGYTGAQSGMLRARTGGGAGLWEKYAWRPVRA